MKLISCACVGIAWLALSAFGEPANILEEVMPISGITGGLCVWLEPGSGHAMLELARGGKFLVHGITSDAGNMTALRQRLVETGLSGFASVEALNLKTLPHADNLVNLLVAEDVSALLAKGLTLTEVLRVLAPNGVACLGLPAEQKKFVETQLALAGIHNARFETKSRLWLVFEKPRPAGMDDWTHWNHGPDNNPVSHDLILERPNQIQWIAGEYWENPRGIWVPGAGSPVSMRSAHGRNYYLIGGTNGGLLARDAFNGVMLWYRSIKGLDSHFVIASGNELYIQRNTDQVTPKGAAQRKTETEVVALDGATGKDLRSYGVGGCWTLLLADGLLLAFDGKKVYAWDALTGVEKWTNPTVGAASTPVVAAGRIFFMRGSSGLTCLDLVSGKQVWQKDVADKNKIVFAFADKVLLCMDKTRQYTAISGIDGATAWTYTPPGIPDRYFYVSAGSIAWPAREALANTVFAGGLLWIKTTDDRDARSTKGFQSLTGGEAHKWFGLDPVTGEVRHVLQEPVALEFCCYPIYDTDRFLLSSRPLYFTDWKTETITRFEGTRLACLSSCGLGQGMFFGMYTPPKSKWCKCVRPAISGITAFASDHKTIDGAVKIETETQYEKGPCSGPGLSRSSSPDDWPMYRCDYRRSSCGSGKVSREWGLVWQHKLLPETEAGLTNTILRNDWSLNKVSGDAITQPTIAENKVFVSLTHAQQVVALDENTGRIVWTFCTGSRMDAPPTIHDGVCMVACHDGWVYGLRADNGGLIWRFRAAPAERRVVAYGEVESAWPTVGGVLLVGDLGYVIAGRSTEADGGLYIHALDIKTGKPVWSERRVKTDDGPIGAWNLRGLKDTYVGPSDLLVSDGKYIAISGHKHGDFNCKTGKSEPDLSFEGPHFGWMRSAYAREEQGVHYPPQAVLGNRLASVSTTKDNSNAITYPGWTVGLANPGMTVEALAAMGNAVSNSDQAVIDDGKTTIPCPMARVKAVNTPPVIDGAVSDLYLKYATPLIFSQLNGGTDKPQEATTAYLLCDTQNLYLVFRCQTPDPEKLVCAKTKQNDDVWQDECVEVFIDPMNSRENKYFHIVVNPAGVTQVSRADNQPWNPQLTVKCGKEAEKAWVAELKVPFTELGLKAGSIGHVWSINLNRSAHSVSNVNFCEYTAWSPTYDNSSHVPERFGHIWLDALQGAVRDDTAYQAWLASIGSGSASATAVTTPQNDDDAIIAAVSSGKTGQVLVLSAKNGSRVGVVDLPSAPAFEGLAVSKGRIYVSLQDGSVVCMDGK